MNLKQYVTPQEARWAVLAVTVGAVIVYAGDQLLGVSLEVYYGVNTYNPIWVLDLILVPFIAGLAVSSIYGLGGKILAHFSPLIVRAISSFPEGVLPLPLGFWILIVIVTVEAASAGGFVGEVIIKRTYGRRPKHLVHKRYQIKDVENVDKKVNEPG